MNSLAMECLASGGVLEPMRVLCLFLAAAACKPAVPSRPGPVEERRLAGPGGRKFKSCLPDQSNQISEVVRIGDGVLAGLAQVHTTNFIHFDVKPSNVLFGAHDIPLLSDFGQSRQIGPGGVIQGT